MGTGNSKYKNELLIGLKIVWVVTSYPVIHRPLETYKINLITDGKETTLTTPKYNIPRIHQPPLTRVNFVILYILILCCMKDKQWTRQSL